MSIHAVNPTKKSYKTSGSLRRRLIICGVLFVLLLTASVFTAILVAGADPAAFQVYIIKPTTSQKVLPDTSPSEFPLAGNPTGSAITVSACRGEFEPASFVIRSINDLTSVIIDATDLQNGAGNIIPKSAIDVRIVKCWYQAGVNVVKGSTSLVPEDIFKNRAPGMKLLVPELLLKDDSLIRVDEAAKMNYLKVQLNGETTYIDITTPDAVFPEAAVVRDADTLLPFDLTANRNKQVWVTIRVPNQAAAGQYTGTISVRNARGLLAAVNLKLTVFPFDLQQPSTEYGLYYTGELRSGAVKAFSFIDKLPSQYEMELQNMKNHGVTRTTFAQRLDGMIGRALSLRNSVGLPSDRLYALNLSTARITNDPAQLASLRRDITRWKSIISQYGHKDLYIYGLDEAVGDALRNQRAAWQAAHDAGAKVFVATSKGAVDIVGDLLDLPILANSFDPGEVARWHAAGKKVFSYGNPQVGVEDPGIYRRNYGTLLLCSGYDGVMDFAYQAAFGNIWNDFDSLKNYELFRDHVFAYPTSNGLIDTVQWEGFREATDDVRYLTTLAGITGSSAYSSICANVSATSDPQAIRQTIINQIAAATAAQAAARKP